VALEKYGDYDYDYYGHWFDVTFMNIHFTTAKLLLSDVITVGNHAIM